MFYALIGKVDYGDPLFPLISRSKGFPEDIFAEWTNDEELKYVIEFVKSGGSYNFISLY